MHTKNNKFVKDNTIITQLRQKARAGDIAAQFELGVRFKSGHGVAINDREAVYWLRKAARRGTAKAQCVLSYMYAHG